MSKKLFGQPVVEELEEDIETCLKEIRRISYSKSAKENLVNLTIIQVGNDPASTSYVKSKQLKSEKLGINTTVLNFNEKISNDELLSSIYKLNEDDSVNAIMVQLPLPEQIDTEVVLNSINPSKDADGITSDNMGKLFQGLSQKKNYFPVANTPSGIMKLIYSYHVKLDSQRVVIVGRSNIVGKPLAMLMMNEGATVTVLHSHSRHELEILKQADVVVLALGVPNYIKARSLKDTAVVIDVGINRIKDSSKKKGYRLVGDFNPEGVEETNIRYTPVPKGVGPLTVTSLMLTATRLTLAQIKQP